jgi:hypothetical protein
MVDSFWKRLPLVVLAIALVIVFHRLLLGEVFFWGLPALQFYPWREYAFDMLRAGQLPLWNPYNGAGAPLIANYQSAIFYPFNWPGLVTPLAWSMSVTAVLHLFIAGWGMWLFTERLSIPALGRGMSALAFGMSSYLVARLGTYPMVDAAVWMPWILWAALGVVSNGRRRDVGWLAVLGGMQLLAGHAQMTWYSMLLAAIFMGWWTVVYRQWYWMRLGLVLIALMLAVGLATIQLLPTAELLRLSQRSSGIDFDFAMNFSYRLERGLNFLSPNVFGNPGDGSYVTVGKGAFFEDAVYVGLIPLLSALAAIISWLWAKVRRLERPTYFTTVPLWLAVGIVAFIFALGGNSPVFPFLYNNIPTFDLFQAPVRWHLWTVFAVSILAGIGVGAWGRGHWLLFNTRLATAACIGAVLLVIFVPRFLPSDIQTNNGVQAIIRAVLTMGILGALAGILTLRQPEQPDSRDYRWWMLAVLLVVAVDLGWAAQGLNPTVPSAFYDRMTTDDRGNLRTYWPEDAEENVKFQTHLLLHDYRTATDNWQSFRASGLANLNLLDRTYLLNNFDPLLVGHFAQYLDLIESDSEQRDILLQASGVIAVYDNDGEPESLEQPGERAWFASQLCAHPSEESVVEAMGDQSWPPLEQVHYVSDESDSNPSPDEPSCIERPVGEVLSITDEGNTVILTVRAEPNAELVLADTFYPGWEVTVDGQHPSRVVQANLAFRAVALPSGAQEIRFEYHPWWLLPGALVSFISLLLTLLLFRTKHAGIDV